MWTHISPCISPLLLENDIDDACGQSLVLDPSLLCWTICRAIDTLYLVAYPSALQTLTLDSDQIKASDGTRHTYTILLAPRITSLCVSALEDAGVYGSVDVQPFPLEFLTLERDVLSLEYENSYKSLFMVDHSQSTLHRLTSSLGRRLWFYLRYGESADHLSASLWIDTQCCWQRKCCTGKSLLGRL